MCTFSFCINTWNKSGYEKNCIDDKYYRQLSLMLENQEIILMHNYTHHSSKIDNSNA